jgi:serine/threonine protein kinase
METLEHNLHPPHKAGQQPTVLDRAIRNLSTGAEHAGATLEGPGALSKQLQDLRHDPLLAPARRVNFLGREVPSLGGVPILAKVGHGGMGAVYFGVHPRLKQEVAIKVLPLASAELHPELIQRFFREAQMAVRVDSPFIVRVLDVNEEHSIFFLIMEYVDGPTAGAYLRDVKKAGQAGICETEALKIVVAASTGLAAAHAKSVVHRDVKPDNIIIPNQDGVLSFDASRLADLGLGRCEALGQSLTVANAALGTPGFMSPEQVTNAKTASKASDIYGIGATLYALLSGKAPFHGGSAIEVVLATVQEKHTPILELCPQLSRPTAELIEICLEKQPAHRFADGSILVDALSVCCDAAGKSEQTQLNAIEQLKVLRTRHADSSAVFTSSRFRQNVKRKLISCMLSKLCIGVALGACFFGYLAWRNHEFSTSRDNLLLQAACGACTSIDDIEYGIGMLESFVRNNSSRTPDELASVTGRIATLRTRRTKLSIRKKKFEQLLAESEQQTLTDPVEALRILEQAESLGAADDHDTIPEITSTAVPDFSERRRRIAAAKRSLSAKKVEPDPAEKRDARNDKTGPVGEFFRADTLQ